jgi:hypothetical protein
MLHHAMYDRVRSKGGPHLVRLFVRYNVICMLYHSILQVMLLKNLDQENGLVNGTRGFVVYFENNVNSALPLNLTSFAAESFRPPSPFRCSVAISQESPDVGPVGHYPMVRFLGCKGTVDRLMTPDKFRSSRSSFL